VSSHVSVVVAIWSPNVTLYAPTRHITPLTAECLRERRDGWLIAAALVLTVGGGESGLID